jgi:hypothetical protein
MPLTPDKKAEHKARKQEKQLKKVDMLYKKASYLHSIGFKNRARDIELQISQIKGEIKRRDQE